LSPTAFRMFSNFIAFFLVGTVIKVADDYLDEIPTETGQQITLAAQLDKGVALYGLVVFAIAVSLSPGPVCTLLFAAYGIGMLKDPDLILPTHLPTWVESIIVIALGILLWEWQEMLSSLAIIAFVQLMDDYLDQGLDKKLHRQNLVHRWGIIEVLLLAFLSGYIAFLLEWQKALFVVLLTPIINFIVDIPVRKGGYSH
jgi:hypothetical protein